MKRAALILVLISTVALAAAGLSALQLNPATGDYSFLLCSSGGSAAQMVTQQNYLMRITAADTTICQAASGSTCASGGQTFPQGSIIYMNIGGSISCRSSASTGNLFLTAAH